MEHDAHRVPSDVREVVKGVEVRPVSAAEQPLWDRLDGITISGSGG